MVKPTEQTQQSADELDGAHARNSYRERSVDEMLGELAALVYTHLGGRSRYNGRTYLSHADSVRDGSKELGTTAALKVLLAAASYAHDLVEDANKLFCVTKERSTHPADAQELVEIFGCRHEYENELFSLNPSDVKGFMASICYIIDRLTYVPVERRIAREEATSNGEEAQTQEPQSVKAGQANKNPRDVSYKQRIDKMFEMSDGGVKKQLDLIAAMIKLHDRKSNTDKDESLHQDKMRERYEKKIADIEQRVGINTEEGQKEYYEFLKDHDVIFYTRGTPAENRKYQGRRTANGGVNWYNEDGSFLVDATAFVEARNEVFEQTKRVNALDNLTKFIPEFINAFLIDNSECGLFNKKTMEKDIHDLIVESLEIVGDTPDFDKHQMLVYLVSDMNHGTAEINGKLNPITQIQARWIAEKQGRIDPSTGEKFRKGGWKEHIPPQDPNYIHRLLAPPGVATDGFKTSFRSLIDMSDPVGTVTADTVQGDYLSLVPEELVRYSGISQRKFSLKVAQETLKLIPEEFHDVMLPLAYCGNLNVRDTENFISNVDLYIEKLISNNAGGAKEYLIEYPRKEGEAHLDFKKRNFDWDMNLDLGTTEKEKIRFKMYKAIQRMIERKEKLDEIIEVANDPSFLIEKAIKTIESFGGEADQQTLYDFYFQSGLLAMTEDLPSKPGEEPKAIQWYSEDGKLIYNRELVERGVRRLAESYKRSFIEDALQNYLPYFNERILYTEPGNSLISDGHGLFEFEAAWHFDYQFYVSCFQGLGENGYEAVSRVMRGCENRDRSKVIDDRLGFRPNLSTIRRFIMAALYERSFLGEPVTITDWTQTHDIMDGLILNEIFLQKNGEWLAASLPEYPTDDSSPPPPFH